MKTKIKATKKYFQKLGLDPDILKDIKDTTIKRISMDQKMDIPEDDEGYVSGIITDLTIDADGDVIIPEGLEFNRYRNNPIVLFNHSLDDPIGFMDDLSVSPTSVHAQVKFGTTAQPKRILQLCRDRVLRTFSVGFIALEEVRRGQPGFNGVLKKLMEENPLKINQANAPSVGRVVLRSMMVELSIVTIPSNMNAVMTEVKNLKDSIETKKIDEVEVKTIEPEEKALELVKEVKSELPEKVVIKKIGSLTPKIRRVGTLQEIQHKQLKEVFLKNWGC